MVKKFRRAAAGIEEQLPSDLRTPKVLSQTCDYLFNELIGNASELGRVHNFVWDRTRAIRNDFTILQVSSPDQLSHAVDCLERIARFHILSLHQLAGVKEKDFQYDWQQDREQLDRTLVSLIQYYDDSRGKIALPNEPEFRAYLIVFQLQDPDMEDRVQSWPREIVQHPRIRKAMKLYAAAGDTSSLQGPLRPPATLPIAQQNWHRFWNLVASKRTSYLTACVAEINFNIVRRVALQALTKSVSPRATADFSVEEMCIMLEFNDGYEAEEYLACYNVTFSDRDEGRFADISALKARTVLPEPSPAPPKQLKSDMVEAKRFGRSLPAVISGFSIKEAQGNGMVDEEEMGFGDADMGDGEAFGDAKDDYASGAPVNDGESLFMPDTAKTNPNGTQFGIDFDAPSTSVFGQPAQQPKTDTSFFGKPSTGTFGASSGGGEAAPAPGGVSKPTPFNLLGTNIAPASSNSTFSSTPSSGSNGFLGFGQPKSEAPVQSASGDSIFATKKDNLGSGFSGFNFTPTTSGAGSKTAPNTAASPFSQPTQSAPNSLFSQPAQSAPNSLFSQPAQSAPNSLFSQSSKPTGPSVPFEEDGGDSPPNSSPQKPDFSTFTSPPAPQKDTSALPAFSFAAPKTEAAKAPSTSFAPVAKLEEGTKQQDATPSFSPQAPTTTTSLAPFSAPLPPPPKPASTPSFNFTPSKDSTTTTSARRGSGSENLNRPAKPSPLAQSYTAGIDAFDTVQPTFHTTAPFENKHAPSVSGAQKSVAKPRPAERKPALPEPDFASLIRDIACNVTLTPDLGLFDQFIEYHIGKVITDVQEELHFERVNAQADEHRASVLSHRYGKLWRDVCRRRRLARQGRERRKRNQQRLLESRSQASETASIADSASVLGRSQFGSTMGAKLSRQEEVDKMFKQSMTTGRWSRLAKQDEDTKGGSKRPTSSHSIESLVGSRDSSNKRLKSTSHVDDSGRMAKLAPTSNPSVGALKRSSFREALSDNPPVASTTKSNYFRLKAMGRAHIYDLAPTHPRKRPHAEVTSSPTSGSLRRSIAASPIERASPPSSKLRRTSSSSVRSRHTAEDTDTIIARARAAREMLRDGAGPLDAEPDTPDPLRQSTGSQVLYDSPSLERARLDARWRASQGTDFGSSRRSDVPAYRLRESKFVPREHYGKAIDRAREMRQSRSRSRPESRIDTHTPSKPAETSDSRPAQADLNGLSAAAASMGPPDRPFGGLSQPHWPTATPSQLPMENTPFDTTTAHETNTINSDRFSVSTFGQHQPQLSGFGNHVSQSTQLSGFADHGLQSNTFSSSMHGIFGQPEVTGTNHPYQLGFANSPAEQVVNGPSNVHIDSLLDDNELQIGSINTLHVNGTSIDHAGNGLQFEHMSGYEEEQQTVSHVNPYAALANGHEEEDAEEEDAEEEEEAEEEEDDEDEQHTLGHANSFSVLNNEEDEAEDYGQYNYAEHQPGVYPGAAANAEYEDEEDGDIEDEDEEDFDEDDSDIDEDEDEEETDVDQYLDPRMLSQQSLPKPNNNAGFATQATTDSEVIELSD
jgi:hypothetical protein